MIGDATPILSRLTVRLTAALCCAGMLYLQPVSAAAVAPRNRPSAAAEVAVLRGELPRGFDIYPGDPCAGPWDVQLPNGGTLMSILVLRYRGMPLMHISGQDLRPSNRTLLRVDPRAVRVPEGNEMGIEMRCAPDRAIVKLVLQGKQPITLNARPGRVDGQPPADRHVSAKASVREQDGNVQYVDADGVHQITRGGNYSEPVLSPDGRTIAFVHLDGKPTEEGEPGFTSLWIADVLSGDPRRLLPSKPDSDDPKRNLGSFGNPHFSLDGGFVYIDADAWTTSNAVHQVSVATGAERFVVAGGVKAVIRTGPYRGYLIVGQHRYRQAPQLGSYDPVYLIRPDGKEELLIPGTDGDDEQDHVAAWLSKNGWQAW